MQFRTGAGEPGNEGKKLKNPGSLRLHNFNVRVLEGETWEQGYNTVLVRFRSRILESRSKNNSSTMAAITCRVTVLMDTLTQQSHVLDKMHAPIF